MPRRNPAQTIIALLRRILAHCRQRRRPAQAVYHHEARGSTPDAAGYLDDGVQIRFAPRQDD